MIKKYSVQIEENQDGITYVEIDAQDGVGKEWIDDLCKHLKGKFSYEIIDKVDGPAGEVIRDLVNGNKNIYVVNNDFDGAEIHPENKEAQEDIISIAAYLKDILESQTIDPEEA